MALPLKYNPVLRFQPTFERTNTFQQSQLQPFHCGSWVVLLQLRRHTTGDLAYKKKSRMELLLHLSSVIQEKHSLIDPYMAPMASLRFQHGRCCWVLNQPQCDTSVKEVLHTRWAFKYSFLCSNVTVLIINTADARWSVVDFINNLTLKTKPRKQRTCRTAPWVWCSISGCRFVCWNRYIVDITKAEIYTEHAHMRGFARWL